MPCRGVERAMLGGDAVQAYYRVLAAPGAPDRQLDLSGHTLCGPDVASHGPTSIREGAFSGRRVMVIYGSGGLRHGLLREHNRSRRKNAARSARAHREGRGNPRPPAGEARVPEPGRVREG